MGITLIFDDTLTTPLRINEMLGITRFGDIRLKGGTLRALMCGGFADAGITERIVLRTDIERESVCDHLLGARVDARFLYFPSNLLVIDDEPFQAFLRQVQFSDRELMAGRCFGDHVFLFRRDHMREFLISHGSGTERECTIKLEPTLYNLGEQQFWVNLDELNNFLQIVAGGTEARHFNRFLKNGRFLTKSSAQLDKISREYRYYWLLPEILKPYFVLPFGLEQTSGSASYRMEQVHAPDMSVQWTYNSLDHAEFDRFLHDLFEYVELRPRKKVSREAASQVAEQLYVTKTATRLRALMELDVFEQLDRQVRAHTGGHGIEATVAGYLELLDSTKRTSLRDTLVVGHGDLCFSNILYDKTTRQLKLIDPKGAATEADLWTDPYYDLAKLSHSVLGGYDYINRHLFDITIDERLCLTLQHQADDQTPLQDMFRERLKEHGYDERLVRLYEAGLFLSMLPLHAGAPRKLLGFVLTALNIMRGYR